MIVIVKFETNQKGPRSYRGVFIRPDGSKWTTPWSGNPEFARGDISDEISASLRDYPDTEFLMGGLTNK